MSIFKNSSIFCEYPLRTAYLSYAQKSGKFRTNKIEIIRTEQVITIFTKYIVSL